jgi:hypothetical protein
MHVKNSAVRNSAQNLRYVPMLYYVKTSKRHNKARQVRDA